MSTRSSSLLSIIQNSIDSCETSIQSPKQEPKSGAKKMSGKDQTEGQALIGSIQRLSATLNLLGLAVKESTSILESVQETLEDGGGIKKGAPVTTQTPQDEVDACYDILNTLTVLISGDDGLAAHLKRLDDVVKTHTKAS
ncbi:hypothetical protein HYFRA_00004781 [Hymenoscyphus fraxineus]|uniref:Uncharacterized protein n=1 Tax=Hymenoscyphus fraxineus TaxID=746836 RepID=A0A9N9PEI1_9HELO|nr:hypothetical protein HYFRA_00004781 [Hymenoscyphus fraxineus]